ncbi:MAG: hypothetical protein R3C05_01350 [Pirellulaceae bacterium]
MQSRQASLDERLAKLEEPKDCVHCLQRIGGGKKKKVVDSEPDQEVDEVDAGDGPSAS